MAAEKNIPVPLANLVAILLTPLVFFTPELLFRWYFPTAIAHTAMRLPVSGLLAVLAYSRFFGRWQPNWGWSKLLDLRLAALLAAMVGLAYGYYPLLQLVPSGTAATSGNIVAAILLAPLAEEVVFRSFIIDKSQKVNLQYWQTLLLSALFFAVSHFHVGRFPLILISGLVLANLYRQRGLASCILLHASYNALLTLVTVKIASPVGGLILAGAATSVLWFISRSFCRNS